jgi:hypothetical protein
MNDLLQLRVRVIRIGGSGSPLNKTVTDTINLTSQAAAVYQVSQSLGLSQDAAPLGVYSRALSHGLGITDAVTPVVVKFVSASDTIVLEQTLIPIYQTSDTLTLVQVATPAPVYNRTVLDSIVLAQTVTSFIQENVSQSLSLADSATWDTVFNRTITDTITLVQDASANTAQTVSHNITFISDGTGYGILNRTVTDSISLASDATNVKWPGQNLSDTLSLADSAVPVKVFNRTLTDSITLSQTPGVQRVLSASNTISLTDAAKRVHEQALSDSLLIVDTASGAGNKLVTQSLALVETPVRQLILSRTLADTLTINQNPFASNNINSTCKDTYDAGLGTRTGIRLTHPYTTPTLTLDLRNPMFGNRQVIDPGVVFHKLRGGKTRVVKPLPTIETINFTIEALSQSERDAYLTFLTTSAGAEIGLLDHENRQWRGVLSSPVNKTRQVGQGCMYKIEFQFRGVVV